MKLRLDLLEHLTDKIILSLDILIGRYDLLTNGSVSKTGEPHE